MGIVLLAVALSPDARAAGKRCGDDVDGRAVACACGDVLVSSRTLGAADPVTRETCPGTGLLVVVPATAPGATLTLGGQTLAGRGHGVGIQVVSGGAGGVTVLGPGIVRAFRTGIASRGAIAAVRDVLVADNASDGLAVSGDGYAVTNCEASHNGGSGFVLGGRNVHADGNRALENRRAGFQVAGRDLHVGEAAGNDADANRRGGLSIRGQRGAVVRSAASRNGGTGVRVAGSDLEVRDTRAAENTRAGLDVRGARVGDAGSRVDRCRGATCP